jgi:hypothetical protein
MHGQSAFTYHESPSHITAIDHAPSRLPLTATP